MSFKGSINKIKKNITEIAEISKKINAELYIITYPWPDTLYHGTKKFDWEKFASDACDKSECKKLINLFPEFKKFKSNNLNWYYDLYIGNDLHISEQGQKIIAGNPGPGEYNSNTFNTIDSSSNGGIKFPKQLRPANYPILYKNGQYYR